jgi:3-oxoacyl-[acyl-carrier protein] reductase
MEIHGAAGIVTGSSSAGGIGAEIATTLAARGCNVVVNYASNPKGAEEIVAACIAAGADAIAVQGDVKDEEACQHLVKAALDRWGRLDVLVNNAAVTKVVPARELDKLDADEFHRIFSVNLIGAYQMIRAAAPHLKASGDSAVVNISSPSGWNGSGSSIAYAASKGALNTLTLSMARVLAPEVRVNALCPAAMVGNWARKITSEEGYARKLVEAKTNFTLRRAVTPADVAKAALWLIEGATVMTGELIRLDSGNHLRNAGG